MKASQKLLAYKIYLTLAALFITSLVVSNLIFQKFFSWNFFGIHTFEISVGILPYPITFLVTDLISEIFGKKTGSKMQGPGKRFLGKDYTPMKFLWPGIFQNIQTQLLKLARRFTLCLCL